MNRTRWLIGLLIASAMSLGTVGSAGAQDMRDGRRVIELGEEVVEGRIEKPEAFYILRPTNLDYESVAMEQSFIPELLETVTEAPF
jgi:hypothetical protein